MKKLLSLSLIAVSSLMLLTACDKQTKEEDKIEYTPPMFELAENDVKLYDYIEYNKNNWNDNENSGGGTNNKVPQYDSSEITIENSDESVDFIIDGSNILYKGKIFNGLYDVVQQLELPCSQTTFINFIVKTYKNNGSNNIYTECFLDSENYEEETYITIHQSLMERDGYIEICEKYNDYAIWNISLYTEGYNNIASLSGCKSFLVYNGDTDLTVDMSEYEINIPTEETPESTEETPESTEETENIAVDSEAEQ